MSHPQRPAQNPTTHGINPPSLGGEYFNLLVSSLVSRMPLLLLRVGGNTEKMTGLTLSNRLILKAVTS
jgi:hypothetical protein